MPRILTYNVHSCFGMDGGLSLQRIAKVIAPCQPDIVCLQELDVGRVRTRGIDQAHAIARELGMYVLFHAALRVMEEEYGNAVLTGRSAKLVKAGTLPGLCHRSALEPRGALWVSVEIGGARVQVITTHLGLSGPERLAQVDALLGPEWLGRADCRQPAILAGDFNAVPRSPAYQRLAARLRDAQSCVEGHRPQATYPSGVPRIRIDHVFVTDLVNVLRVESLRTALARIASDHLPLAVDFALQLPPPAAASPDTTDASKAPTTLGSPLRQINVDELEGMDVVGADGKTIAEIERVVERIADDASRLRGNDAHR